ncbi:hypothetical protein [Glycomyces sp. NPDC047010]|uniref:hypothetical protein n=1 Tax=Glycomyces sp. NPDC047010 TaxID=3155023 RepID=UPI0033F2EF50
MIDTPTKPATGSPGNPDQPAYPARKVWWIVGGSITGAALVTGFAIFGAWSWVVSAEDENDSRTEQFDQAVSAVDVTTDVGDVQLDAADGTVLDFRLDAAWRGDEPDATEEWSGTKLLVRGECTDGNVLGLDVDQCQTNYTLALPAGTDATAETGVGDIRLDGLDGDIDVVAGVGSIDGADLRSTGVTVSNGVGDVDLEFDEVLGDITVDAGAGDVTITVPDDGTTFDVQIDGGVGDRDIRVATDPSVEADYVINVTSGVGTVTVKYGV